jgi:hypothetical protein
VLEVSTIGLDIAKQVFHAHGADASGRVVFRRRIVRAKLIDFFRPSPGVWLHWRHAAGRITGDGNSQSWTTWSD